MYVCIAGLHNTVCHRHHHIFTLKSNLTQQLQTGLSNWIVFQREKCYQLPAFLCWIPPRMHQCHQYINTSPAKTDANIFVGGCKSSAGRRLMQYVPVRWSHKHCNCSQLPLAGQHRRGIMWMSTSWYHGPLILLCTSFVDASETRTWNWNWRANLWTVSSDILSPSAFVQFVRLKDVSRALISVGGVISCCWGQGGEIWM